MTRRCGDCIYWVEPGEECRVNPPTVFVGNSFSAGGVTHTDRVSVWPNTTADDWCGQFEPKKRPRPPLM